MQQDQVLEWAKTIITRKEPKTGRRPAMETVIRRASWAIAFQAAAMDARTVDQKVDAGTDIGNFLVKHLLEEYRITQLSHWGA